MVDKPNFDTAAKRFFELLRQLLGARLMTILEIRLGEAELRVVGSLLGRGGQLVDIGANTGPYSLLTIMLGRGVTAFEPHPDVAGELRHILGPRALVHETCLSNRKREEVQFFIPVTDAGTDISKRGSIERNAHPDYIRREVTVRTAALDDYDLDDVALIKIDVEGHEWPVLQGCEATLATQRPTAIVEIEDHRAPGNIQRVTDFFNRLEYDGWFIQGRFLCSIASFNVSEHQSLDAIPRIGDNRHPGYINNFIWIPRERSDLLNAAEQAVTNTSWIEMLRIGIRACLLSFRARLA